MPPDGKIIMMVNTLEPNVYTENLVITVVNPQTEVSSEVDPTYMITIPAAVDFGALVKDSGTRVQSFQLRLPVLIIEEGYEIVVSVSSDFNMYDGDGAGPNDLPYSLYNRIPGTYNRRRHICDIC